MFNTALIPYTSGQSTNCWKNRLDSMQEHVINKSFQVQIADYKHFHCDELKDVFWILSSSVTPIIQRQTQPLRISLDSAITDARNLARTQLFSK